MWCSQEMSLKMLCWQAGDYEIGVPEIVWLHSGALVLSNYKISPVSYVITVSFFGCEWQPLHLFPPLSCPFLHVSSWRCSACYLVSFFLFISILCIIHLTNCQVNESLVTNRFSRFQCATCVETSNLQGFFLCHPFKLSMNIVRRSSLLTGCTFLIF